MESRLKADSTPKAGRVGSQLELTLVDYNIQGASIGSGPHGLQFACTIGPVSQTTVGALHGAAQSTGRVCLLFPEPLLLDLVVLEHRGPSSIRIVGHVVESVAERSGVGFAAA